MDDAELLAAAKDELAEAGVPPWAPYSPDGLGTPRLYAWVDDDGTIRSTLVGDAGTAGIPDLLSACDRMLAGEDERRPGSDPTDLTQLTALVLVESGGGIGHGTLSRAHLQPLRGLLLHARAELTRLA